MWINRLGITFIGVNCGKLQRMWYTFPSMDRSECGGVTVFVCRCTRISFSFSFSGTPIYTMCFLDSIYKSTCISRTANLRQCIFQCLQLTIHINTSATFHCRTMWHGHIRSVLTEKWFQMVMTKRNRLYQIYGASMKVENIADGSVFFEINCSTYGHGMQCENLVRAIQSTLEMTIDRNIFAFSPVKSTDTYTNFFVSMIERITFAHSSLFLILRTLWSL